MTTIAPIAEQPVIEPPPVMARRRWIFPLILVILYIAVASPFVWTHACWRDEAQAFLLSRDSATPWDLVMNSRYEGHPLLWHMCLWVLTRVIVDPFAMQILHLAMAATSVYLFARFAPMPALTKILFTFSYYALFEYSIVARNYQIMLLLALVFCILWQRRRTAFLWQGLVLGLLANTNAFGALLSFGLFTLMLTELHLTRTGWRFWKHHYVQAALAILIFVGLAAAAVATMHPPEDSDFATEWFWNLKPYHVSQTLFLAFKGLIPVPNEHPHFWNSSIFSHSVGEQAGIYLLILIAALLLFSPRALLVYVVACAGILTFLHVKYPGSTRHQGSLFVTLISCSWIALALRSPVVSEISSVNPRAIQNKTIMSMIKTFFEYIGNLFRGLLQLGLIALLCLHVWGSYIALKSCWSHPFSSGDAAYAMLKNKMTNELLVAEDDMKAAPITAHLPGRELFYLRGDRWGTFILFKKAQRTQSAFRAARKLADERQLPAIVILYGKDRRIPREGEMLGSFGGSIAGDDYTIYRIQPRILETRPATTIPATTPTSQR